MKSFIIITLVVLLTGFLLYFVIKEFIKTYKNKPYGKNGKCKKRDRL